MKKLQKQRGITLIALVVTIIILLILAGVTINIALSDNGLFSKSKQSVEKHKESQYKEELEMVSAEILLAMNMGANQGKTYAELYKEKLNEKLSSKDSIFEGAEVESLENIPGLLKVTTKDGRTFWIEETGIKETEEDVIAKRVGDVTIFPKEDYGKVVTGYNSKIEGITWKIWYVDNVDANDKTKDTIYLIGDFITTEQAPKKTIGEVTYSVIQQENERCLSFTISGDYGILNGYKSTPTWVWDNKQSIAQKWLSQWYNYGTHKDGIEQTNTRALCYMMDTTIWTERFGDLDVNNVGITDYVIGGPTIEMYCASYKDSHPTKYLESRVNGDVGYELKWNTDNSYNNQVVIKDDNEIYIPGGNSYPKSMWMASPSNRRADSLVVSERDGVLKGYYMDNSCVGFCPVVCLKSGVQIQRSGDGFVIKN